MGPLEPCQMTWAIDQSCHVDPGAGLGRTATTSPKAALEFLLKAPCSHMDEVYNHPEHVEVWRSALRGDSADLSALMKGYAETVDWPAGVFWLELSSLFLHALVVLTVREFSQILEKNRQPVSPMDPLAVSSGMIEEMMFALEDVGAEMIQPPKLEPRSMRTELSDFELTAIKPMLIRICLRVYESAP
jgi:hypothetical protein